MELRTVLDSQATDHQIGAQEEPNQLKQKAKRVFENTEDFISWWNAQPGFGELYLQLGYHKVLAMLFL